MLMTLAGYCLCVFSRFIWRKRNPNAYILTDHEVVMSRNNNVNQNQNQVSKEKLEEYQKQEEEETLKEVVSHIFKIFVMLYT